jgi:hypothetical protein
MDWGPAYVEPQRAVQPTQSRVVDAQSETTEHQRRGSCCSLIESQHWQQLRRDAVNSTRPFFRLFNSTASSSGSSLEQQQPVSLFLCCRQGRVHPSPVGDWMDSALASAVFYL